MVKIGVYDLLEDLEDVLDKATGVVFTSNVMVDKKEIHEIIDAIKRSLPDDVQQAHWLREQHDEILENARKEYNLIVMEAKKQADCMVEDHIITERASQVAADTYRKADQYAKDMTMNTYDYIDRMMFEFKEKMNTITSECAIYIENAYKELENSYAQLNTIVEKDIMNLRRLAEDVKERPLPTHSVRPNVNFEDEN